MAAKDEAGFAGLAGDLPAIQVAFTLEPITLCRYLSDGWMNQNWRITAGESEFVLKQILDVPASTARNIFSALSFLETQAIPVCTPVRSAAEDTVVDVGDRSYCLVPWVGGSQRSGTSLSLRGVENLGRLVGRIHMTLARLPAHCQLPPVPERLEAKHADARETAQLIARIDGIVARLAAPASYDMSVRDLLKQRLELLAGCGHLRPGTTAPVGPFGWVHGDLSTRNLLFRGEDVVAVLDWDRMRVAPYAAEVIRAGVGLFCRERGVLDLRRISAFTAGYRTVMPTVGKAALADAVSRLFWKRLTDVWPLEFRYVRGDPSERIAGLFPAGERTLEWWAGHLDDVTRAFAG